MKSNYLIVAVLFSLVLNSGLYSQSGWSLQSNPLGFGESAMIGRVEFVSPTEGWISGSRGTLLHTTDAGTNWIIVDPWPADTMWSGSDPGDVMDWVGSTHGWKLDNLGPDFGVSRKVFLHKTTDGGLNWTRKTLSSDSDDIGFKVQFVDQNNGWVLIFNFTTMSAKFLRTIDGGESWGTFNGSGIFYFVDANNGFSFASVGPNGMNPPYKIFRTIDGGNNWTEQFNDTTAGGYNNIFFVDTNYGWIVGDNGKVLKTTNGGVNWSFVTNSGINPLNRSKAVYFINSEIGWISSKSTLPSNIPFFQHTTDGGNSWITQYPPIEDPYGSNAIFSIYFADAQNGWLTADYGRICRYAGVTSVGSDNFTPGDFNLSQNYPNPFNPTTKIKYEVPEDVKSEKLNVKITVYDIIGNELAILIDQQKSSGTYEVEFNSAGLTSGVYFYKLTSGNHTQTRKMILLK